MVFVVRNVSGYNVIRGGIWYVRQAVKMTSVDQARQRGNTLFAYNVVIVTFYSITFGNRFIFYSFNYFSRFFFFASDVIGNGNCILWVTTTNKIVIAHIWKLSVVKWTSVNRTKIVVETWWKNWWKLQRLVISCVAITVTRFLFKMNGSSENELFFNSTGLLQSCIMYVKLSKCH